MADFSISKLPWHMQLAAFVGLSLAGAGAFYYFYEIDAQKRIQVAEAALATVRAQINKGQATARRLPEFRKEVAELQAKLDSLRPILPEEKDAADLLRRVNTLAVQSNLAIRGFRPQATDKKALHAEWPIELELEGTYHNLGIFLDSVSKVPRIINVSGLVISSKQTPEPNATIDIKCTATTFVLLEPETAKPPTGTAKPPAKTK